MLAKGGDALTPRAPGRQKSHRWFAAVWNVQTRLEPKKVRELRDAVAGPARGRVLELGCGTGTNFGHYGDAATNVIATEPDMFMLRRAAKAAAAAPRPVRLCRASAEQLPFADRSFDTVVSTLNFCTIPDPLAALREVRRVLAPGGEYRFLDHVRYDGRFGGWVQDVATPVWRWCGAGCHPNRDIDALILRAGFTLTERHALRLVPPVPPFVIVRPALRGVARPA